MAKTLTLTAVSSFVVAESLTAIGTSLMAFTKIDMVYIDESIPRFEIPPSSFKLTVKVKFPVISKTGKNEIKALSLLFVYDKLIFFTTLESSEITVNVIF